MTIFSASAVWDVGASTVRSSSTSSANIGDPARLWGTVNCPARSFLLQS